MTARQARFYVWAVDIWRQSDVPVNGDFGKFTLLASSVACLYASKRETIKVSELGREATERPLDRFDFAIGTDVRDTDVLHLVSGPDPADVGRWFAVTGGASRAAFRAQRLRVLAKSTLRPTGAV